jgi:ribosome biogenesis GTPase A
MGLDLFELAQKKVICKRCHGLQNFGKVEESLRPGWTQEPLMSQQKFRDLLAPIREKPAVLIALVDLFDFAGSVLTELDAIAGDNPVLLAANKVDLLPPKWVTIVQRTGSDENSSTWEFSRLRMSVVPFALFHVKQVMVLRVFWQKLENWLKKEIVMFTWLVQQMQVNLL